MSIHQLHNRDLTDPHGRRMRKLRVQVTDACNFRCFYCMPRGAKFRPPAKQLGAEELVGMCARLVELGIDDIRVSGGEPMLRKDWRAIVDGLSALPVKRLGITTNGYALGGALDFLKSTRCRHINVSLDSLDRQRFREITGSDGFDAVRAAVLKANDEDFRVKVNVVAMRGINDHELFDFIDFSARHGIEVRFLELMKIGACRERQQELFISARELIERIEGREKLSPQSVNRDSTAFNFTTASGAAIGFIASESQPFCAFCSRLRLLADGTLRACLMSERGISLCGAGPSRYPALLQSVMKMKPTGRIVHIQQPMYQIGG